MPQSYLLGGAELELRKENTKMIGAIIVGILVLLVAKEIFWGAKVDEPEMKETDDAIIEGKFTPKTLCKYNGSDNEKIFIAVKGRVFNVTKGASFYGPGGPYANFAGRDASRGLAKSSFELSLITPIDQPIDTLQGLSSTDLETLDQWEEHFENKYPVVGVLVNEDSTST